MKFNNEKLSAQKAAKNSDKKFYLTAIPEQLLAKCDATCSIFYSTTKCIETKKILYVEKTELRGKNEEQNEKTYSP